MNRRAYALGAVMILLASLVAVALRSYAEATFLKAYGAPQAPWLLIATAAGFAVATLGYDALTRVSSSAVDFGLLIALGVIAAASPQLLASGTPPVVIVIALTAASQVASLALWNRVAASVAGRDARRMLPRAGAAVTLGGAIAGLGAGVVIPRVGLATLPYIAAGVTTLVLAVCVAQDRALVAGGAPGGGAAAAGPAMPLSKPQRDLVAALIAVAAVEAVITTVIDLQFLSGVKRHYADHLGVALALFYGGTNAILFVLQISAVPHVLVTRNTRFTAAIHPLVVILSYLGFAIAPGFVAIAGTRTADQVLRLATSRTSQELELSAVPPIPRARWKLLLRGLIYPAAVATTAYALFLIGPTLLHESTRVAAVAIAIAVVWAIAARIAAARFQRALAAPLGIQEIRRDDPRRIDLETLERWTHAAGGEDVAAAALARAALARASVDPSDLADHLRHDEADVRAAMFAQLARTPFPALRGELRAALAIEDDDRALAFGIKALALAGDDAGIARGKERAGLSKDVDAVTRSATLLANGDVAAELPALLARDPAWAVAILRARRDLDPAPLLAAAAAEPATRAGALLADLRLGAALLPAGIVAGEPTALAALASLGELDGDATLEIPVATWPPVARAIAARALAGAPAGANVVGLLVADRDPEVAHAALRTALAFARSATALPPARIVAALDSALAALAAHLAARDAMPEGWSACARAELEIATRRCVARVLWAFALEAAAAGRDPSPIAATARRLVGGDEADRKRALDVVQELQASPQILAAIERWLKPPVAGTATLDLSAYDPWLAQLVAGELAALEPTLGALRRPALFASLAGPALAELAAAATARTLDDVLFDLGATGDAMFVVTAGALVAKRAGAPDRRIEIGGVVGELAVLTRAPRAATVVAAEGGASVLAIDRAAFTEAARRAPELVLGLSATLAGWLAPNRPDLL